MYKLCAINPIKLFVLFLILLINIFSNTVLCLSKEFITNENYKHTPIVLIAFFYLMINNYLKYKSLVKTEFREICVLVLLLVCVFCFSNFTKFLEWQNNMIIMTNILIIIFSIIFSVFKIFGSIFASMQILPYCMLLLIIPVPHFIETFIEKLLVSATAPVAEVLINLMKIPVSREGANLYIPGIILNISSECSGYRSTLMLLIFGIFSSDLLVSKFISRAILLLIVIPLGIIRNAFRVMILGVMCVHYDNGILDSWIHHQGGPVFFAFFIIPFILMIMYLRKREIHLNRKMPKQFGI